MLPKDLVALQALQLINEVRKKLGAPTLHDLLPGQRCNINCDSLANSLSVGTNCKFSSLLGWVSVPDDTPASSALWAAWGTEYDHIQDSYFVCEPKPIREFVCNFDQGLYPGLIESPENPVLPLYTDWRLF